MPARRKEKEKVEETKEVGQESAEPEVQPARPLLIPVSITAPVEHDPVVQHIGRILKNGTVFSAHPHINFAAHNGLLIKMRVAYEQYQKGDKDQQEAFFSTLQTYLEQSQQHLPHAAQHASVEQRMTHVRSLVTQIDTQGKDGFVALSTYLLRVALSALDRF